MDHQLAVAVAGFGIEARRSKGTRDEQATARRGGHKEQTASIGVISCRSRRGLIDPKLKTKYDIIHTTKYTTI